MQIENHIFYELEYEETRDSMETARSSLKEWFESQNWSYRPSRLSKFAKALQCYGKG
jgi:hypothetical protein